MSCSTSPAIWPPPAPSSSACAAGRTVCTPPWSLAQDGKIVWTHVERGDAHHARLQRRVPGRAILRTAGAAVCRIVGAYEIEGAGIQLFERVEGDHFTIIGLPLLAAAGGAQIARSARHMIRACVIGWPVSHSRSPLIHGYWLEALRHRRQLRSPPRGARRRAQLSCAACATQGFAGCNVTLPHKEAAFAVVDETRPAARAAGCRQHALVRGRQADRRQHRQRRLHEQPARSACPVLASQGSTVSVLGAGGAARGIVFALLEAGVGEVRLFNRTRARADAVAAYFGAKVKAHRLAASAPSARATWRCWSTPPRSA